MDKIKKVPDELLDTLDSIQIYGGVTAYGSEDTNQGCNSKCTQEGCINDKCIQQKCDITISITCNPYPACELRFNMQCGGMFYTWTCGY